MPYCQKCGTEIADGAKFCPACGEAVYTQGTFSPQMGTLTIKRLNALTAAVIETKVKIDGVQHGGLRVNEEMSIDLPYGTHTVELKVAFNPSFAFQITLNPENSLVFYPFKIGASGKAVHAGNAKPSDPTPIKIMSILMVLSVLFLIGVIATIFNDNKQDPYKPAGNVATSEKPTPTPEPSFEPVLGTVGNWEVTVNDFNYQKAVSAGVLHEYKAEEGSKYCIINLSVKNVGKEMDTFLPFIAYGDDAIAKIQWNDYEYTRSELIWSKDNLSNETINPLVTTSGDIVFEIPDEVINSEINPILVIKSGKSVFECELVKK